MRRLVQFAKSVYLVVFNRIAYRMMRRKIAAAPASGIAIKSGTSIKLVCGYGHGGIANGARYNGRALTALGYAVEYVDVSRAMKNPLSRVTCGAGGLFVFHCAAPEFLMAAWPLRHILRTGRIVGYFAWELADPPDWPAYDDLWDEIWTPSRFSATSLAKLYHCPIYVVPHVLLNQGSPRAWRKGEEPLAFLAMADARSSLARKNPLAAVAAFRRAFLDEADVRLTIKLQTGRRLDELDKLVAAIGGDQRIRLISESLSRGDVDRLFTEAQVFVSLHRAEGFGLPLLEARLAGLATIATAWSGNLDFMSEADSILVPAPLVTMHDDGGVYGDVTWADPDIAAAAAAMQRCYQDPAYLLRVATAGWEASRPELQLGRLAAVMAGEG